MQNQTFQVVTDPVADALDDMAALGLHWTRNRERGRMPSGIRQAMILVARDVLAHVDVDDRITTQMMDDLCGPAAFARNADDKMIRCGPNGECLYCGVVCDEPCSRFVSRGLAEAECSRIAKPHGSPKP